MYNVSSFEQPPRPHALPRLWEVRPDLLLGGRIALGPLKASIGYSISTGGAPSRPLDAAGPGTPSPDPDPGLNREKSVSFSPRSGRTRAPFLGRWVLGLGFEFFSHDDDRGLRFLPSVVRMGDAAEDGGNRRKPLHARIDPSSWHIPLVPRGDGEELVDERLLWAFPKKKTVTTAAAPGS